VNQGEFVARKPPGGNAGPQKFSRGANPNENGVQRTRAWSGFWVVFGGDVAIAAAASFAVWRITKEGGNNTTPIVAILTSAFTAVSTMTTAYFGIKTMSNTAQSFAPLRTPAVTPPHPGNPVAGPPAGSPPAGGPPPGRPSGPPIPADPARVSDAEIVARMQEPPHPPGG
jgi:hypothetical protein